MMEIKAESLVDSIRRNNPYFEDLITRCVYNSNAIEGNTLSYYETYALIFNDNTKITATPREIYDVINLKSAFDYVFSNFDKNLTIGMIKWLGIAINKGVNEVSSFRTQQVFIRGTDHIPPSAGDVPRLISELVYGMKLSSYSSVFEYIADFHCQFERVHPFIDGNGRTGRLLIIKQSLMHGLPPVVIPFEKRSDYMDFLQRQDITMLASLLESFSSYEKDRMKEFGIKV